MVNYTKFSEFILKKGKLFSLLNKLKKLMD